MARLVSARRVGKHKGAQTVIEREGGWVGWVGGGERESLERIRHIMGSKHPNKAGGGTRRNTLIWKNHPSFLFTPEYRLKKQRTECVGVLFLSLSRSHPPSSTDIDIAALSFSRPLRTFSHVLIVNKLLSPRARARSRPLSLSQALPPLNIMQVSFLSPPHHPRLVAFTLMFLHRF